MRELIIARIKELLALSHATVESGRWASHWYDKDCNMIGYLSNKQVRIQKPTHIVNLDLTLLTDEKLAQVFESTVMKYYRQM